jgi:hypothetical protein
MAEYLVIANLATDPLEMRAAERILSNRTVQLVIMARSAFLP